jgi:hypothetical protein
MARPKAPKDVPGSSVQNPSDPDAGYSGHKGKGYQAQIAENVPRPGMPALRIITFAKVERASDQELAGNGLKPAEIMADTAYGGDGNWVGAGPAGASGSSPRSGEISHQGKQPGQATSTGSTLASRTYASLSRCPREYMTGLELCPPEEIMATERTGPYTMADFISDDHGRILGCPRGLSPTMFLADARNDWGTALFERSACRTCHMRDDCLAKVKSSQARLTYRYSQVRIAKRRAYQDTAEFKDKYRMRSGIEATNSQLARSGMKRLPVRGLMAVTFQVMFKSLGENNGRITRYVVLKAKRRRA